MNSSALTALLNLAHNLGRRETEALEDAFEAHSDSALYDLSHRVSDALGKAGVWNDKGYGSAFYQLSQLDCVVRRGGGNTVGTAVLARDLGLIDPHDFDRLTSWWVAAGGPLP